MASSCCNSVDYRKKQFQYHHHSSSSDDEDNDNDSGGRHPRLWNMGDLTVAQFQNLALLPKVRSQLPALALVYVCGDWHSSEKQEINQGDDDDDDDSNNQRQSRRRQQQQLDKQRLSNQLQEWFRPVVRGLECQVVCGKVCLTADAVDDLVTTPPENLPALALVSQKAAAPHNPINSSSITPTQQSSSTAHYLPIKPADLQKVLVPSSFQSHRSGTHDYNSSSSAVVATATAAAIQQAIQTAVQRIEADLSLTVSFTKSQEDLRIFIAGDRSSVGKSSVCLGLLGNLLAMGYAPSELAYIKPATQSESKQLIQTYCENKGIACIPIGPLVYYRGFTRAFLAGETASTDELLAACGAAVDRLSRGKQVVLMDGVGFPAVGSICGTDNAAVALACSYPLDNGTRKPASVLLVGGSGVGSAVDAFNLNATYFERANMPVMGAIFNKLSTDQDNFYSLQNCKEQVTKYFHQNEHQRRWNRRPFGFCPLYEKLKSGSTETEALANANEWIRIFGDHVDVAGILEAAQRIKENPNLLVEPPRPMKRVKMEEKRQVPTTRVVMSRQEIEQAAIRRGAPISA